MKWCYNGTRHIPGEDVEFAIQFENKGNLPTTHVTITDTLDPRLLASQAEDKFVEVGGTRIPNKAVGGHSSHYTFEKLPNNVVRCEIIMSEGDTLQPNETGMLVFSVPIDSKFAARPGDVIHQYPTQCLQAVEVQNHAYSMFQIEGKLYKASCDPPLEVMLGNPDCGSSGGGDCCNPCMCIAIIVLGVVLLVLLLLLWYCCKSRKSKSA